VLVYGVTGHADTVALHPFDVFRREITIKGSFAEITSFAAAIAALKGGRARTDGIITHRFGLDEYPAALDAVANGKGVHKVVIECT
jgi:D-arabinitol dehydrogenase (NADP+)